MKTRLLVVLLIPGALVTTMPRLSRAFGASSKHSAPCANPLREAGALTIILRFCNSHVTGLRLDSLSNLIGKTTMNKNHLRIVTALALSLVWVGCTDVYIRLCATGHLHDYSWHF